ncbi:4'-phosphopantetheinyl transferase family protein [Winogradskyella pacifica]|uniref:4'-phosphopantetheinyl transferase family protein n=1 Tax=Winogradskyella pacifica TaxID=664642 RepID=UPI0015CB5E6C|nr:4'-phosphopantetheinyl transferase superfamily protein [Winogradskyella pacifica]
MKIKNLESRLFCGLSKVVQAQGEASVYDNSVIKLFKIELSQYYNIIEVLSKFLSPQEVLRAQRYHQLRDSNRFIICRSFLKILIAKQKSIEVSQVYFEKGENHKPYFPLDKTLFFNVSHAGDFAIIAFGNCELGVDIEKIDQHFDYSEIIPVVYDIIEIDTIQSSKDSRSMFYKFWTRKEAIVKAIGKGIDEDLIKIPVTDGFHNILSALVCNFKNVSVISFKVNENHIGALALTNETLSNANIAFYPSPTVDEIRSLI